MEETGMPTSSTHKIFHALEKMFYIAPYACLHNEFFKTIESIESLFQSTIFFLTGIASILSTTKKQNFNLGTCFKHQVAIFFKRNVKNVYLSD